MTEAREAARRILDTLGGAARASSPLECLDVTEEFLRAMSADVSLVCRALLAIEPTQEATTYENAAQFALQYWWSQPGFPELSDDQCGDGVKRVASAIAAAVLKEREECARIAENHSWPHRAALAFWGIERGAIAASIRTRGAP